MSNDNFQNFITSKFGEGAFAQVNLEEGKLEFFRKDAVVDDVNTDIINTTDEFIDLDGKVSNWESTRNAFMQFLHNTPKS
ncbi:MAG: hypothetical protein KDJ35_07230 [Alphaproteobacteria bacterium]|nr:hypothetical protein [Alphaproteobacteria bacterium]